LTVKGTVLYQGIRDECTGDIRGYQKEVEKRKKL